MMSRSGDRLRAFAARMFDSRTMERVIDPTIADLQRESGLVSYVALIKVAIICGWQGREHGMRARTFGIMVGLTAILTLALELPYLIGRGSIPLASFQAMWLLYLAPQALVLSVPMALTFVIAFAKRGTSSWQRFAGAFLVSGAVCSVTTLAMLDWVLPDANQAFRVSIFQQANPGVAPARDAGEMTFRELKRQIEWSRQSSIRSGHFAYDSTAVPPRVRQLEFQYYVRWALGCASFVLAFLMLAIHSIGLTRRAFLIGLAFVALMSYYVLLFAFRDYTVWGYELPAASAAWLPTLLIVLIATTLVGLSVRRRPGRRVPATS